jgi:S-adenosylmethionine:tRNA ribosyltransferase-isomerase
MSLRAATLPLQRPRDARLLVIDPRGHIEHRSRTALIDLLREGDCVIANDAATLPASLPGIHRRSGAPIEVRLAGRASLDPQDVKRFSAVVFGAGDFCTPTEARPMPPALVPGDRLTLGIIDATIVRLLDHPRLVELEFDGDAARIWRALAEQGRPVQYAHMQQALALGCVDANRRPTCGVRTAFGRLRARLADPRHHARARYRLCHADACRRALVHRR